MKNINKASAFASAAHPFYEAHGLAEDIKAQLEETAQFLISVTRRSTEETFKYGEELEKVAPLLPEGTLEKWAIECCGCTARHVRTHRAVFHNLCSIQEDPGRTGRGTNCARQAEFRNAGSDRAGDRLCWFEWSSAGAGRRGDHGRVEAGRRTEAGG